MSEAMDSMVSFNPNSCSDSAPSKDHDSKHIQVELKGQNQTLKFISSDALKEKVSQQKVGGLGTLATKETNKPKKPETTPILGKTDQNAR